MDSLQNQISAMNIKLDALHQMLEQLSDQTIEIASKVNLGGASNVTSHPEALSGRQSYHSYSGRSAFESEMEHKDILADVGYTDVDAHGAEHHLTPEIQIQRLTAQLTAAYNRIAALEEQLIAKRFA
jgi:hypothetical protein